MYVYLISEFGERKGSLFSSESDLDSLGIILLLECCCIESGLDLTCL